MNDIVKNAQKVMIESIKFLELNGMRRIFSKNDSHLLIFKRTEKFQEATFDDIHLRLNIFLSRRFKNSKFKLGGIYTNGVWFHQNSYVLRKKSGDFVVKGDLKKLGFPKTIRMFGLDMVKEIFNGNSRINFSEKYTNHKNRVPVTFNSFMFKEGDDFFVFVKEIDQTTRKMNFVTALSNNFTIDADATYDHFEDRIKHFITKVVTVL